jgi:transcriptional regulator with GAF, ATPase, and Fis domain
MSLKVAENANSQEGKLSPQSRSILDRVTTGLPKQASFNGIISQSTRMQRVFGLLQKVAKANSTVLILGESGTGKELVAKAIHHLSSRSGRLVPVNCGAIPEEILESELFGHERGAFTGAITARQGRFQLADGGTIFLDEIGEMSSKLQVKLLRVLQERKVDPVGSTKSIPVDVRVIAATNKNLREQVRLGKFREDLYYRLQVVPIELPSLRDRAGDIPLLAQWFIHKTAESLGVQAPRCDRGFMSALEHYSWPGNIRELENLIERLVVLHDGEDLTLQELPSYIRETEYTNSSPSECSTEDISRETQIVELEEIPEEGIDFNSLVNAFESKLILSALHKTDWNKKAAAELLQLNRTTLVEKIRKKGIEKMKPDMLD